MDGDLKRQAERIDGRRTCLMRFGEGHLRDPRYLAWLRDHEVIKTIGRAEYLTEIPFEEVEAYWRRVDRSPEDLFYAIHMAADGAFVGTAKAGHIDWEHGIADIGIMIGDRAHWGGGVATDALGALCRHLFEARGLRRLTAGSMAANPAMVRVFEKLGFALEGTLRAHVPYEGGYTDHVLLGCLRGELRLPDNGEERTDGR